MLPGPRTSLPTRVLAAVRVGWAIVLVVAPRWLIAQSRRDANGRVPAGVLRVLGVRHLLQAVTTLAVPERAVTELGAGADAMHAMTALGLAATSRPWRRAALADGALAGSFGVAGWLLRPQPDHYSESLKGRRS